MHYPALAPEEYCTLAGSNTHESLFMNSSDEFFNNHSIFSNDSLHGEDHGGGGGGHHVIPQPNTAFKTFIIQYFTYAIAMYLKLFKTHHALGKSVSCSFSRPFGVTRLCYYWKVLVTFKFNSFKIWLRGVEVAIAPWFHLRLQSCGPGFESQAHHLRIFQFVLKL